MAKQLEAADVRVTVDDRNEKIGKKIREAELKRIPYPTDWRKNPLYPGRGPTIMPRSNAAASSHKKTNTLSMSASVRVKSA